MGLHPYLPMLGILVGSLIYMLPIRLLRILLEKFDMTENQMLVDLAFKTKVLMWSGDVFGSVVVGVLGYVVTKYNDIFDLIEAIIDVDELKYPIQLKKRKDKLLKLLTNSEILEDDVKKLNKVIIKSQYLL
ncbi:hypothetical protein H5410_062733 [Solanum commersonii]|uniref:Uncharacterized protein n=1 Tax=Solanum commersonii TaxID=4109 RepID=A0A9J5WCC1_SOLCO|nr:hypothetical protein H5410_062733 [Solanum commersonii]